MKHTEAMPGKAEMLLRFTFGLFMLLMGVGKFMGEGGIAGFVDMMSAGFAETMIGDGLAGAFLHIVPFVEVILGIWLLIGYRRVWALFCTGVLMALFFLGQVLLMNMGGFGTHLIYLFLVAFTLTLPACGCWCMGEKK